MNPLKPLLRRLSLFMREAGQFSRSKDVEALRRQGTAMLERLDAIERRMAELRAEERETRDILRRATAAVRDLHAAVGGVEKAVDAQASSVRRDTRDIRRRLERLEPQMQAVLRYVYVPVNRLAYPYALTAHRFGILSQNGEDGIVWEILRQIGDGGRRFVDIGCSDHGWNTGFLAEECGWSGLMVDANTETLAVTRARFARRVRTAAVFVTPDNIDELFQAHGFTGDIDVLSIDVDGSDYWLWRALTVCRPRVVIVEYNSVFGPDRAVVVPYAAGREWDEAAREHRYFGASLKAIEQLGLDKGYRLVAVEADSANAFLIREDVAGGIPAGTPGQLFRPQRKYTSLERRSERDVFEMLAALHLPLVELDA